MIQLPTNVKLAQEESMLTGLQAAYREVERSLNNAELALRSNTPLIRLLDRPIAPLTKHRPSLKRWVIYTTGLASFFFVLSLIGFQLFQLVQNKIKN